MSGYGVFMTHSGLIPMDAVFARALRKKLGLGSVAVVHGIQDRIAAEKEEAFDRIVDLVEQFSLSGAERALKDNLGYLSQIEEAGGESTVFQDIYQDRWLLGRFDLSFQAAYLAHAGKVLHEVLGGDVQVVMGEMTMAVYRMARRLALGKAPYLYGLGTRFYPRFYLEDGLELGWRQCRARYDVYMRNGIPDSIRAIATETYLDITQRMVPHVGFASARRNASLGAEPIHQKLRWEKLARQTAYWRYDYPQRATNPRVLMSPWAMSPLGMAIRWLSEGRNARYLRAHALGAIPEDRPFCSYFLHYQPEYTVEGVGFPVADQGSLIRAIAQSLPIETLLLVKEQPFMLGRRTAQFYRSLLALPNVRLVNESASSRELIRRSQCVFSISGTCALEALFFGVPAVLFSKVFHAGFKGITQVLDLYGLPEIIRELTGEEGRDTSISSIAALAAIYSESYAGHLMSEVADPAVIFCKDNQQDLGNGLIKELQRRKGQENCSLKEGPPLR